MILVTGGTGLVGSHLLFQLLKSNEKVRAIYRRAHKLETVKHVFGYYTKDVETLYNKVEWVEANINDIPALAEAFLGVSYVYHCAAFISFEPDKYFEQKFTQFQDYPSDTDLNAAKDELILVITEMLSTDIFNKAVIN